MHSGPHQTYSKSKTIKTTKSKKIVKPIVPKEQKSKNRLAVLSVNIVQPDPKEEERYNALIAKLDQLIAESRARGFLSESIPNLTPNLMSSSNPQSLPVDKVTAKPAEDPQAKANNRLK